MPELANREEFEIQLAGELGKVFGGKRAELQSLLGQPPNVDNVPITFWDEMQQAIEDEIMALAILVMLSTAKIHGFTLATFVVSLIAADMARQDSQAFVSNAREKLHSQGSRWSLLRSQGKDITQQDIADTTIRIIGPRAAENLAVTEVSHAQSNSAQEIVRRMRIEGRQIVMVWKHTGIRPPRHSRASNDPCPICSPRENGDEKDWLGLKPGFAHPHCDCFIEIMEIGADGKRRKVKTETK